MQSSTTMTTPNNRSLQPRTALPADLLKAKVWAVFGPQDEDTPSVVVDKAAVRRGGKISLPRYVTEFLIAEATSPKARRVNYQKVWDMINEHLIDSTNQSAFKSNLMRESRGILIGSMTVIPKPEKDKHDVKVAQPGDLTILAEPTHLNAN